MNEDILQSQIKNIPIEPTEPPPIPPTQTQPSPIQTVPQSPIETVPRPIIETVPQPAPEITTPPISTSIPTSIPNPIQSTPPIPPIPPQTPPTPQPQAVPPQPQSIPNPINTPKPSLQDSVQSSIAEISSQHPMDALHSQTDPYHRAKDLPGQKPIRTYEGDIAEILAQQKTSMISIATAENEKKLSQQAAREKMQQMNEEENRKEETINTIRKTRRSKKLLITLVSLLFIIGGAAGGYLLYLNSPVAPAPVVKSTPTPNPLVVQSIITPDSQKIVDLTTTAPGQIAGIISSELKSTQAESGKIFEIVPALQTETAMNKLTSSQFIESMNFTMSDTLQRSLTDKWMLGVYGAEGYNFPFIILTSDFFQNTFAGMLRWESDMPDELSDILNFTDKASDQNATSTFISTDIIGTYTDKIIRNRDIREFVNNQGEILFLYTFLDQNTIIITTSEAVIPGIVERIDKQTYIR